MMLRGASADALVDLTSRLQSGLGANEAHAATVGSDLFAVAGLLRAEPALRRVVTDVSVSGDAKAELIRGVLSGKAAGAVVDLVGAAVQHRWTSARDLADALEHLGVVATVKSAGQQSGRLEDEIFAVGQAIKDNPELRDALSDPSRSTADKRALVGRLLQGKALPATIALVEQALAGTHRTVGVALTEYQKVAADVHGQRVATVRVAQPLADNERERLANALSAKYDRPVHLNVVVDPEVIGGIRVEIGDDVIDGTVSSKLAEARRKLAG